MTSGRFLLGFILFAALEVIAMSAVADFVGWPITLLMLIATGIAGSTVFRHQGTETWNRLNQRLQAGASPGQELIEGAALLVGGVFLITPGFITDSLGALLLIPGIRRKLAATVVAKGGAQAAFRFNGAGFYQTGFNGRQTYTGGNVYEGEAKVQPDHRSANDSDAHIIELHRPPSDD